MNKPTRISAEELAKLKAKQQPAPPFKPFRYGREWEAVFQRIRMDWSPSVFPRQYV